MAITSMAEFKQAMLASCEKTTNPQACSDEVNALNWYYPVATLMRQTSKIIAKYSAGGASTSTSGGSSSTGGGFDLPDFSLPDIVVTPTTPGQGSTPPVYTPPIIPPSQSSGSFLTSTAGMVTAGVAVVGLAGLLVWKRRQNARRAMPMSGLRRNKKGQFVKGRRGRKSVRGLGCTCTC